MVCLGIPTDDTGSSLPRSSGTRASAGFGPRGRTNAVEKPSLSVSVLNGRPERVRRTRSRSNVGMRKRAALTRGPSAPRTRTAPRSPVFGATCWRDPPSVFYAKARASSRVFVILRPGRSVFSPKCIFRQRALRYI